MMFLLMVSTLLSVETQTMSIDSLSVLINEDCKNKNKILINRYCEIQTRLLPLQLKTINLLSKMKIVKKLTLPVLVSLVMGLASCSSDDNTVHYSTNSLKNTELMTVLKSKGYQFDKDGCRFDRQ